MSSKCVNDVLEGFGVDREKTGVSYGEGELRTYLRYVDRVHRFGAVVHDDRISFTVSKNQKGRRFPLNGGWEKSPGIRIIRKDPRVIGGEEKLVRVYGFAHSITMKFPELRGVRLTSSGNFFRIEIHNRLNLEQKRSRLRLFIEVLMRLHDMGILVPGSESYLYRLSQRFKAEQEVRWDLPYGEISRIVLKLKPSGQVGHTLYFQPPDYRGVRCRLYPYHKCFWRFEMIFPDEQRVKVLRKGSPRHTVDMARVQRVLSRHRELNFYLRERLVDAAYLEDLGIDGRDLFHLSQPRNQYTVKML